MTPGFKGTLWVALIIGLFAASVRVKADTRLDTLIADKQVVYVGSCWFDAKGTLTFKFDQKKRSERCIVGMKMPDTTKHYVLTVNDAGNATRLVMYDETTKMQVTLWTGGKEA